MILENIKAVAAWVWNWITVLVATVLGVMSEAVQYIDQLTGLDWSQVISKEHVALMVFWTAVVKTIVSIYNAQKVKS